MRRTSSAEKVSDGVDLAALVGGPARRTDGWRHASATRREIVEAPAARAIVLEKLVEHGLDRAVGSRQNRRNA